MAEDIKKAKPKKTEQPEQPVKVKPAAETGVVTEKGFLQSEREMYAIYQIKDKHLRNYGFLGYDQILKKMARKNQTEYDIDPALYNYIFAEGSTFEKGGVPMMDNLILEELFQMFNEDVKPLGYKGRSLSVGDIVVLRRKNTVGFTNKAYYVDRFGFEKLNKWVENIEGVGLKALIPSHKATQISYILRFYEKDIDRNCGLEFPCDKDGKLIMSEVSSWADDYLTACYSGNYEKPEVKEARHTYLEPGYYMCPCSERFSAVPDSSGQITCPSCKRIFNASDGKEVIASSAEPDKPDEQTG